MTGDDWTVRETLLEKVPCVLNKTYVYSQLIHREDKFFDSQQMGEQGRRVKDEV